MTYNVFSGTLNPTQSINLQCFGTVGWRQEGHPACKTKEGHGGGGHCFFPDGVAPSQMVCVSASVNLPLHHKVQKFSAGTGSPRWSRKKGRKTVVVVVVYNRHIHDASE